MQQTELFNGVVRPKVINVATVPMRSPFRYPGGKTWLVPYVRQWLKSQRAITKELIEPFAGGGVVSLTAVFERLVKVAILVERDEDVASVWRVILSKDAVWLTERIISFEVTERNVQDILETEPKSLRERAFSTILRNRVNRGGILAPGAGIVKRGENEKGLLSRWYPRTLKKRIMAIHSFKDKIKFIEGDGLKVMEVYADNSDAIFFTDPPYTIAGRRLYKYSDINHDLLFKLINRLRGDVLVTYDDAEEIRHLAERHRLQIRTVAMKSTHHVTKNELLIGRNLEWFMEE